MSENDLQLLRRALQLVQAQQQSVAAKTAHHSFIAVTSTVDADKNAADDKIVSLAKDERCWERVFGLVLDAIDDIQAEGA